VSTYWGLASAVAPYGMALSTQPNDWSVTLTFTGGGLAAPYGVAVDGSGDVWVVSYNGSSSGVSEFSPLGAALNGASLITGGKINYSYGLAIDTSGDAWVGGFQGVTEISPSRSVGTSTSLPGDSSGYSNYGTNVAIDANGAIYVNGTYNLLNSPYTPYPAIFKFTSAGVTTGYCDDTSYGGVATYPTDGIAVGPGGNILSSVKVYGVLVNYPTSCSSSTGSSASGNNGGDGVAYDGSQIWGERNNYLYYGGSYANTNAQGNYLLAGLSLDGLDRAWGSTTNSSSVLEYDRSLNEVSPATGYEGFSSNGGVAVDGSGNVWVSNPSGNSLQMLVGGAAPVAVPLAWGVANGKQAARP
jgi:hypothetical protein